MRAPGVWPVVDQNVTKYAADHTEEHDGADRRQRCVDLRRDIEEVQCKRDDRGDDDGGEVDDHRVDAEPDGARHQAGVIRRRAFLCAGLRVDALGGGGLRPRLGDRVRGGGLRPRVGDRVGFLALRTVKGAHHLAVFVARRRGGSGRQVIAARCFGARFGHGASAGAGGGGSTRGRRRSSRRATRSVTASARRVR